MDKVTLGVIVGNRGFFPDHLCEAGRQEVLRVLAEEGIGAIILDAALGGLEEAVTPRGLKILKEKQWQQ